MGAVQGFAATLPSFQKLDRLIEGNVAARQDEGRTPLGGSCKAGRQGSRSRRLHQEPLSFKKEAHGSHKQVIIHFHHFVDDVSGDGQGEVTHDARRQAIGDRFGDGNLGKSVV